MIDRSLAALATITGAFIGAITGISGGLLGARITNKGHLKRLEKELLADAIQRDLERKMSLRREVYLTAAEAIAEAHSTLIQILDMDTKKILEMNPFVNLAKALSKIHVVGREKTIEAVTKYNDEFLDAILYVLSKKLEMDLLRIDINSIEQEINSLKENGDIAEYLQKLKVQKQVSEGRIRILASEECFIKTISMQKLLVESNLAIREEMELSINEQYYRNLMDHSRELGQRRMDRFLENTRNLVPALREDPTIQESGE